jgi:hypothetical protein
MKELNEYRAQLLERLVSATKEFCKTCLADPDPFAPLDEGDWNIHQVATHTRDVHVLVYRFRAQRTAQEENPLFQNFDGEAYMAEHYDADEPLKAMLDGFVASVQAFVLVLERLPVEAWSRESRHATFGGGFTLQTWVERDLAHIEEHLKSVKREV